MLAPDVTLAVAANLTVVATLNLEIGKLEARLLLSIPGIGKVLATVIMLETGDVHRFAQVGNDASCAPCVSSIRLSNDKKRGEGNTKNGNAYLVGVRRSGQLRPSLQPRRQKLLRQKESQNKQYRGDQGAGAQAGAGELPHAEGGTAFRREALFRLKVW